MKHLNILLTISIILGFTLPLLAQPNNFGTSLHKTRNGKPTWYDTENGGFETLTGVPIENLGCVECHDAVDANGDPYPVEYTPDCVDCHATGSFTSTQDDCLGCHSREAFIIGNANYSDVHRDASTPLVCWDCHGTTDMHGDGTEPASMFDDGGIVTDCEQAGCHTSIPSNTEHNQHLSNIHCTSCHMETSLSCYNCHFESQVEHHVKRAKAKITGFTILVNRTSDGKVHPATFQSLSYDGNTWIAMGPSTTHTIVKDGARTCNDCHNWGGTVDAINEFNSTGMIQFATWNSSDSTLSHLNGVIPLPADYKRSFKLDFIQFDGDWSSPPGTDNKNWSFVKGEADGFQLLYSTPLTTAQMNDLGMDTLLVGVDDETNSMPSDYKLEQNYPNPFNPTSKIVFRLAVDSKVTLNIFDILGQEVTTLVNSDLEAGSHEFDFDASGVNSGVYFYRLDAAGINGTKFSSVKKMVLMK
jgi:hypothetical protein